MTEKFELDLPRRGACRLFGQAASWEEKMFRLIAIVSFAFVTSMAAQATPAAPVHEPDSIITQAAAACGPGMTRVSGVCVSRHHKRQARRCLRWNGSTCAAWE
jgi:hypothetical protein